MFVSIREVEVGDPIRARRYGAPVSPWRWLALLAALAAFAQHRLAAPTDPLASMLGATGASLGRGAAVVGGWAPVLLAIVGYAIVAPQDRRAAIHDRLARHVLLASVLATVQLAAADDVVLAAGIWILLAVVAADAYLAIAAAVASGDAGRWIGAPFAALLGYAAVIAALAIDGVLATAGVTSALPALGLVVAVVTAAVACGLRAGEPVLPAVVAAALLTVSDGATGTVGALAFAAGALAAAATIVIAATRLARPPAPVRARPRATRTTPFADAIARQRFVATPSVTDLRVVTAPVAAPAPAVQPAANDELPLSRAA